jgi:hypothetical protein
MKNHDKGQKAATTPLDVSRAKRLSTRARPKPEPRPGITTPSTTNSNMQREDRLAMLWIMGVTLALAGFGLLLT